ncbi:hypothetical protein N0V95_000256 [Ascochyta clinopodiicola]|nr:hypothetical protein N0V95_000256 [Ascochyta clinopodiicola]
MAGRQDLCGYSQVTSIVTTAKSRKLVATTKASQPSSPGQIIFSTSYPLFEAYSGPSSRLVSYNATRMRELQLMHQWSTVTYVNSGPRNMEVFRDWTVNKALEYSYLMDILLAFTSLHSASEAKGTIETYDHVSAALHYQNQSIAELNRGHSLARITQETCEPVVLVTALNAICTLLASLLPSASDERLESIPEVMLQVRMCMLGLNEVIEQCRSWAESSELARIFRSPDVQRIEDGGLITADKVRALCDAVLANTGLDDAATPFVRSALQKMEKAYANNNGRSVFGWLVMIEAEFFHKVGLGDTAAMVTLACWGTLTFALEEVWWTKYAGKRIVEDLFAQLRGCDSRWNEILKWCYGQVGICNKVN